MSNVKQQKLRLTLKYSNYLIYSFHVTYCVCLILVSFPFFTSGRNLIATVYKAKEYPNGKLSRKTPFNHPPRVKKTRGRMKTERERADMKVRDRQTATITLEVRV